MKTSSTSVLVRMASVAIAPPSAIEPVSPMNTSAGNALNQRKPIDAADQRGAEDREVEVLVATVDRRRPSESR